MAIGTVEPRRATTEGLVGRAAELGALDRMLQVDRPWITFVHGVAGVGKSSLLRSFSADARSAGAIVIPLDCRALEPTDRGVSEALASALGLRDASVEAIAGRLQRQKAPVVLLFDHYEVLRLVDTWLRQSFVPVMPDNVRLVIAGREPPVAAWLASPELAGAVRTMPLSPLDLEDAVSLFVRSASRRLGRAA